MNKYNCWKLALIIALLVTTGLTYSSQKFDQIVLISDIVNDDLYAAGQSVQVTARVHGDVTAAGQRVSIEDMVDGDVNVAGEIVTISAPVADDIRAAGRLVTISAAVGDHVVAAGESVIISAKASTQGWAKLAGRQVEVLGNIGKDLTAAGQHVIIGGDIQGNAEITADTIVILSTATINGKLIYRSHNKPDIRSGAVISGAIEQLPMPDMEGVSALAITAVLTVLLVFGLALILAGIVYFLIFPSFSIISAHTLGEQPLQSIGLGIAVLVTTPFIILLLMMTIIGYLLALCLLAVYLVLLLPGLLTGIFYIADLGLRRAFKITQVTKGKRILAFIVTAITLAIVLLIPILGVMLLLLLLVAGSGALQLQLWRRYSTSQA